MGSDLDEMLIESSKDPELSSSWITDALYFKKESLWLQDWLEYRAQAMGKEGTEDLAKAEQLGTDLFENFHAKGTALSKEVRRLRKLERQIAVIPADDPYGMTVPEVTQLGIAKAAQYLAELGLQFARVPLRPPPDPCGPPEIRPVYMNSQDPEMSSDWITDALYYEKDSERVQSWIEDRSLALGKEGTKDLEKAKQLGMDLFETFHARGTPLSKELRSLRKWGSQIAVVPADHPQGMSLRDLTQLGIDKLAQRLAKLGLHFAKVRLRSRL